MTFIALQCNFSTASKVFAISLLYLYHAKCTEQDIVLEMITLDLIVEGGCVEKW